MKLDANLILISIFALTVVSCQKPVNSQTSKEEDFSSEVENTSATTTSSSEEEIDTCQHLYEEVSSNKGTIIEPGVITKKCLRCGKTKDFPLYDLDEFVFEDGYFTYDGQPHNLLIKGMIPYGTTVEYENNSLTEIGNKEATANIYDQNHNLLVSKKANINIIENTGFANIYIDTNNAPIEDKVNYVPMTLSTTNCDSKYQLNNVQGGIRLRGNGTMTYDKKAYRIKFNSKTNMLGLNKNLRAKSWVLIADYADQSMMRNATAFYMGNSLYNYSNNYCSDYQHVNVYLNGSYNGVYLLAEQQQANAGRIKVNEPETNDTSVDVGYLLELDAYATKDEENYFTIGTSGYGWGENINGINMPSKDYTIKTDVYSQDQINYIKKYTTNVFTALKNVFKGEKLKVLDENHNLIDSPYSSQYETLNTMIDLESLFKMYIIQEYMKDVDVGYSSFYLFVDFSINSKYPRLTFGAPWDFDWSSGNVYVSNAKTPNGEYNSTDFDHKNVWLLLLSKTDFFRSMMKKYYSVFVNSGILEGAINQANDEAEAYKNEFAHNYERWETLGTVIPKYTPDDVKSFKVHKDAVDYLTNWLTQRKASLDNIFLK